MAGFRSLVTLHAIDVFSSETLYLLVSVGYVAHHQASSWPILISTNKSLCSLTINIFILIYGHGVN